MRSPRLPRSLVLAGLVATAVIVAAVLVFRGSPTIQRDEAGLLAKRSDAVAASLARGERCAANRRADALRTEAAAAVRRDLVAPELARELLVRTTRLARQVTCPPPPPPVPPVQPSTVPPDASAGGDGGHGRGERGRGKKRGHGRGEGRDG